MWSKKINKRFQVTRREVASYNGRIPGKQLPKVEYAAEITRIYVSFLRELDS